MAAASIPVEEPASSGRALVLATGVAAAMLAAVMVIAVTPPRSDAPVAITATTLPPLTVQLRSAAVQNNDQNVTTRESESVRIGRSTMSRDNDLALVGSPNAISAAPADPDALDIGLTLPEPDERVYVLTKSYTFVVRWSQTDRLVAPDGSAVVSEDGELLATFADGEFVILVD